MNRPFPTIALAAALFAAPLLHGAEPAPPSPSIAELTAKAEQGDAEAQLLLGGMYYNGEGTDRNLQAAFDWIKKSAEQGNEDAQFHLATMYYYGMGTPKDPQSALNYFKITAERGRADAQFYLGGMYYRGEGTPCDLKTAIDWIKKSAEQDNAEAQFHLGMMYSYGQGLRYNFQAGFNWLKKSADQGNEKAQLEFAKRCYSLRDFKMNQYAFNQFKKLAEQGNIEAKFFLGMMYYHGLGIEKNTKNALPWLEKAAKQGQLNAAPLIKNIYLSDLKNDSEALAWLYVYSKVVIHGTALDIAIQKEINECEQKLGANGTQTAQKRAREIQKEIDACKSKPQDLNDMPAK